MALLAPSRSVSLSPLVAASRSSANTNSFGDHPVAAGLVLICGRIDWANRGAFVFVVIGLWLGRRLVFALICFQSNHIIAKRVRIRHPFSSGAAIPRRRNRSVIHGGQKECMNVENLIKPFVWQRIDRLQSVVGSRR